MAIERVQRSLKFVGQLQRIKFTGLTTALLGMSLPM
jgi:hypothetical protein